MRSTFADTSFFVAVLNQRDNLHQKALSLAGDPALQVVTTQWVFAELANWFAAGPARVRVRTYIDTLSRQPRMTIEPATESAFTGGLSLYHDRPDKSWSLTDCISFQTMREYALTEALTADTHFEQAGFRALLL